MRADVLSLVLAKRRSLRGHERIVFHRVLEAAAVAGWQVRQHGSALELLPASPARGVDTKKLGADIAAAVALTGARRPSVDVIVVDSVPPGAAGKRPRVVAERKVPLAA